MRGYCRCSCTPAIAASMPQIGGAAGLSTAVRSAAARVMSLARNSAGFVPISPELVPTTLFARRKFWAERFGIAPVLPTTRAEMDELGWDSLRRHPGHRRRVRRPPQLRDGAGRAAAGGAGLPGRHHRAARLARRRGVPRARPPDRHVGRHRRQHGLDGQPLHVGPAAAPRRRVFAGRRGRPAPGSRADRLRAALPRGVRRRARRHRRHRGEPAPDRALRLLVEQGAAVDPDRFARGSARLRQRRARRRRDRAPAGGGRGARQHHRPARHGVLAAGRAARRLDRDRFDDDRRARAGRGARRSVRCVRARTTADAACAPASTGAADASCRAPACGRAPTARARSCACPTSTPSRPIRCCTRTRRASCTWRRTRGTRARWSSGTARATSG